MNQQQPYNQQAFQLYQRHIPSYGAQHERDECRRRPGRGLTILPHRQRFTRLLPRSQWDTPGDLRGYLFLIRFLRDLLNGQQGGVPPFGGHDGRGMVHPPPAGDLPHLILRGGVAVPATPSS